MPKVVKQRRDGVVQRYSAPSPLDLPDLAHFTGTEEYHSVMGVNVTDGVVYVMKSGYSWAVTDALVILKSHPKVRGQPFVAVKLVAGDDGAVIKYTDGNDKVFYTQRYEYSGARKSFDMYFVDGVLLLAGEY